jgi:transcriptional regulator GlxA family with amidase domain
MFKQSTGMPPHQYLAQVRIERARELLLHTSLPIGDIAFCTGFDSPSRFSQFFRQHMRCTPQEYRRQRTA